MTQVMTLREERRFSRIHFQPFINHTLYPSSNTNFPVLNQNHPFPQQPPPSLQNHRIPPHPHHNSHLLARPRRRSRTSPHHHIPRLRAHRTCRAPRNPARHHPRRRRYLPTPPPHRAHARQRLDPHRPTNRRRRGVPYRSMRPTCRGRKYQCSALGDGAAGACVGWSGGDGEGDLQGCAGRVDECVPGVVEAGGGGGGEML